MSKNLIIVQTLSTLFIGSLSKHGLTPCRLITLFIHDVIDTKEQSLCRFVLAYKISETRDDFHDFEKIIVHSVNLGKL
jgi:hypothetical protein